MRLLCLLLLLPIPVLSGCAAATKYERSTDYFASYNEPVQGARKAGLLHKEGIIALEQGDLIKAERLLKQSLGIDNRFGPAHNTLGTVYFQQRNFYPAAWEFEYAQRMMPSRPEPANNLGLVYEQVQRLDDAMMSFEKAIEIEPTNAEYLGNWIRLKMKQGEHSDEVRGALQRLLEIEFRPDWAEWARRHLAMGDIWRSSFGGEACLPTGGPSMEYPLDPSINPSRLEPESIDGNDQLEQETLPPPISNGEELHSIPNSIPTDSNLWRDVPKN